MHTLVHEGIFLTQFLIIVMLNRNLKTIAKRLTITLITLHLIQMYLSTHTRKRYNIAKFLI